MGTAGSREYGVRLMCRRGTRTARSKVCRLGGLTAMLCLDSRKVSIADSRMQINEPDIASRHSHHESTASSALAYSGITSASSPASAMALLASAHPDRFGLAGKRRTIAPSTTETSASVSRPSCARIDVGMMMPFEFPMRRIAISIATPKVEATLLRLPIGVKSCVENSD